MARNKIRLGINIDHIATIKTNRKTSYPSLIEAVKIAEDSGADLITVHLLSLIHISEPTRPY